MRQWLLILICLLCLNAHAHKPSDSYLVLNVQDEGIVAQWDIALRDLDFALGLDLDGDAQITWGEVKAKFGQIDAYALSRLELSSGGQACPAKISDHLIDEHTDGAYVVLRFKASCNLALDALQVRYSLFFELDPQHKGLARLESNGQSSSAIFHADSRIQEFQLKGVSRWRQFVDYCREGIWHIWIGYDHILFLVALLLPAVVRRGRQRWEAVETFKPALVNVVQIVTSFTIAHSITLALATFEIISLPSRLVESVIAASVVLVAVNNIMPVFSERRWAVAFGFGLVHGFGFASVLSDLGLPQQAQAISLIGFNVGVELGQLAIVAVALPLAFVLRKTQLYRSVVLLGGSLLIAMLALAWFIERAFNLKFLPF